MALPARCDSSSTDSGRNCRSAAIRPATAGVAPEISRITPAAKASTDIAWGTTKSSERRVQNRAWRIHARCCLNSLALVRDDRRRKRRKVVDQP